MKTLKEKSYTVNIVTPESKEEDEEIKKLISETRDISHLRDIKFWTPQKAGKDIEKINNVPPPPPPG